MNEYRKLLAALPALLLAMTLAFLAEQASAADTAPEHGVKTAAAPAPVNEAPPPASRPVRTLRVCADPNNMPFSNEQEEGFENRIAEILADELDARLDYTWWAQRRGFIRNTLKAGKCDVVLGVPQDFEMALTTVPYYRSSYMFVQRADRAPVRSLDDPALKEARIGVHLVGDDYTNVPPAHALARHDIVGNLKGYPLYGDYREPNPPARLLTALAEDEVDVAIAWGPLAGYFARRQKVPLTLAPVPEEPAEAQLPMSYAISLGVRHGEEAFKAELEAALARRHDDIRKVLDIYGIPESATAAAPADPEAAPGPERAEPAEAAAPAEVATGDQP